MLLNISIALIVFMGMASGGMLALVLMSERRQQTSFSAMFGLTLLLAVGGAVGSAAFLRSLSSGLVNGVILLILSFALGYALTTFSVLSSHRQHWDPQAQDNPTERTAVICLAPGEPPDYQVRNAAKRLELADDPSDVPPLLLRPFYMRDLKSKYAAIGRSPYKESHLELAQKVQSRLDSSTHRVYPAFYSDYPTFAETINQVVEHGLRRVVIAHVRVTGPPDPVQAGDLWEGMNPERLGLKVVEAGPFSSPELLPQVYVRRMLEAVPQVNEDTQSVGLLLVGRGHITPGDGEQNESSAARQTQEHRFLIQVRQALARAGFDESRMAIGWLRYRPSIAEAVRTLTDVGCKSIYWLPASFPADGISTLYDIPLQLEYMAREKEIKLTSLGAWNADDLAAEEIAARVRAVSGVAMQRTL